MAKVWGGPWLYNRVRNMKKCAMECMERHNGVLPDTYEPITIFILAPGAFFVLAGLTALQNKIKNRAQKKGKPVNNNDGCAGGCASCAGCGSTGTNE